MAVQAYVLFKVTTGTERETCQKIADLDEVLTVGIVYGEYDLVAKITVPSLVALDDFLSDKIRQVPSIILTSTMIVSREYRGKNQRNKKQDT